MLLYTYVQTTVMGEHGFPDIESETLGRFPELARARNLYIDLFKDDSSLVNCGYTAQQKVLAKDALQLIEGPGKIYHPNKPKLTQLVFMEGGKWAAIKKFANEVGYELTAVNEPYFARTPAWEVAYVMRTEKSPVFEMDYVAIINLVKQGTVEDNLDSLIHTFFNEGAYSLTKTQKENPLSKVTRALGMTATYRARWVDESTKLEFVIEIKSPTDKELGGPFYHTWRRLNAISDAKGKVIPFGRKANVSKEKVLRTLDNEPASVVHGQLAWQSI